GAPAPGTYDLYAERLGYYAGVATLELQGDQEVVVEFRLEPAALAVDSLEVTARAVRSGLDRVGFTSRSQSGTGHFLTREELLERGRQRDITDALRTVTGVRVESQRFGPDRLLLRRVGTPMDPRPYCHPFLFLDGLPVQPPWEDLVDLEDVAAVEVYPDAGMVPASFASRGQTCGVVVVWSRLQYGGGG
ncbi:MAG: Plug domain-containing protein, partial [Gemmatimonadetes bacterium]|nr:Plug domain-containing protein [Gemmatimonadota bacterium]